MADRKKKRPAKGGQADAAYSSPATGDEGKVQVLVEVKVPRQRGANFALQVGAAFDVPGFELDADYAPVPVQPDPQAAAQFEAERQETVVVRGTVDRDKISELEAQDDVVAVWTDAHIEPFATATEEETGRLELDVGFGPCPIPPCDCSPTVPKGTIADVAQFLEADKVWERGCKGQGIVVGVVDGGITAQGRAPGGTIPNVIGGWTSDWGQVDAWGGHGNMSATDVLGLAPDSKIYDLRIASGTIGGTLSNALAAYQWAITQFKAGNGPHILTNSWGLYQKAWAPDYATDPNHPFTKKVVEAIEAGILVLFAAGNCGETCPSGRCSGDVGPGKDIWGANGHPLVMTVGAANKDGQWIGYSSQGPAALDPHKPDFCGVSHFTGFFTSDNGTSAACPVAAGVVALLKQGSPTLTQATAKAALKATATNLGPAGWDQHSGSGIINARKASEKVGGCRPGGGDRCRRYADAARKARAAYRRTGNRRYLCLYYRYVAAYYCCRYRQTNNPRYRCLCYGYLSSYHCCVYQVTRNRAHLCRCYYYRAQYYCCRYRLTRQRRDLCACYRFRAAFFCCLAAQQPNNRRYQALCRRYRHLYQRCRRALGGGA